MTDPLCLAFANTLDLRLGDAVETLHDQGDLVAWARARGLVGESEEHDLRALAAADPAAAARALGVALRLREAIYRVVAARLARQAPDAADLEALDEHLARVHDRLVPDADGSGAVRRTVTTGGPRLEQVLGPVARDAADLLVQLEDDLLAGDVRLRSCPGSPGRPCGWLFVDTTRNRNRRYCVSALCGNRARAHRFADRRRTPRTEG